MKLLLIEDSCPLAESIKKSLDTLFVVTAYCDKEKGLCEALDGAFEIIILDLGESSDGNEIALCKSLRRNHVSTPILMLTTSDDVRAKVAALSAGADDCMAKPFHMDELKARVAALLRRTPDQYHADQLAVNDLILDSERRRVERGGVRISLRRKEFDILECLVRNRGRPVTRSMILDYAWDGTKISWNNTVDVHIKHLRDKIDRPFASKLIRTAYGIGYVIDD